MSQNKQGLRVSLDTKRSLFKSRNKTIFGEDSLDNLIPLNDQLYSSQIDATHKHGTNISTQESQEGGNSHLSKSMEMTQSNRRRALITSESEIRQQGLDFKKFHKVSHFYKMSRGSVQDAQILPSEKYQDLESQDQAFHSSCTYDQRRIDSTRDNRQGLLYDCFDEESVSNLRDNNSGNKVRMDLPLIKSRQFDRINLTTTNQDHNLNSSQEHRIPAGYLKLINQARGNPLAYRSFNNTTNSGQSRNINNLLSRSMGRRNMAHTEFASKLHNWQKDLTSRTNASQSRVKNRLPFYNVTGNEEHNAPTPIYPYNKSLITYQLNQKLLDDQGFETEVDKVLTKEEVDTLGKHKVEDRLDRFEADFRGRVGMLDLVLNSYMNEAKHEFLIKPSPYHTREEIRKYIDKGALKEKGRNIFIQKGTSDFDIIHVKKMTHFTDHQGNYLTKTGHKIDDFSLEPHKVISTDPSDTIKNKLKEGVKRQLTQIQRRSTNFNISRASQMEVRQEDNQSQKMNQKKKAPNMRQMSLFTQKLTNLVISKPPIISPHKLSLFKQESLISPGGKSPLVIRNTVQRSPKYEDEEEADDSVSQTETEGRESNSIFSKSTGNTQHSSVIINKAKGNPTIWNNIQLKTYSKLKEFKRLIDEKEEALVEFIKKCEQGLQLPFNLMNCIKANEKNGTLSRLVIDFRITEAAAKGLGEAIKILGPKIDSITLKKIDVNDQGLSMILNGIQKNPFIRELALEGCELDKASTQCLIKILSTYLESRAEESDQQPQISLKSLILKDCKSRSKELNSIIDSFVQVDQTQSQDPSKILYTPKQEVIPNMQIEEVKRFFEVEHLTLNGLKLHKLDSLIQLMTHSDCLKSLDLSYNQLKTSELETLTTKLSMSSLKELNLAFNSLSSFALMCLGEFVKHSWTIMHLDLSFTCKPNQEDLLEFINKVRGSQTLQALHMSGIQLSDQDLKMVRQTLGIKQSNIERRVALDNSLTLDNNQNEENNCAANEISSPKKATKKDQANYVQINERLVFHRITGHPEIERSEEWHESEGCWICDKSNYCIFFFQSEKDLHFVELESSFCKGGMLKFMKIEDFLLKIGSKATNASNNWYEILHKRLKYAPYTVLDIQSKDFDTLQQPQWWIATSFLEPKVTHNLVMNGERFSFQVPPRGFDLRISLCKVVDTSEVETVDPKKQSKEEQLLHEMKLNYPKFRMNQASNCLSTMSPDASPSQHKQFSMFPSYKRDDSDLIARCFETDFRYSQITSLVENSSQMSRVSEFLSSIYYHISDMFTYEIADSDVYPFISLKMFQNFCEKYKLLSATSTSEVLRQSFFKEIFSKTVKQNSNAGKSNQIKLNPNGIGQQQTSIVQVIQLLRKVKEDKINRFQFLELLFRVALKYHAKGDSLTTIERFMSETLLPQWDYQRLSAERLQLIETQENDSVLRQYASLLKYLTEFLLKLFPQSIKPKDIQRCFILSKKQDCFAGQVQLRYIVDEFEENDKYFTLDQREYYEFITECQAEQRDYQISEDKYLFNYVKLQSYKLINCNKLMQTKLSTSVNRLYNMTLERIFQQSQLRKFAPGEKANIDQMRVLCNYFDNPQKKFKTVHVAGTNGKGYVALKTAQILQKSGLRTGLLSSPHISSFRERVTVDSEKMQEDSMINHAQMVFDAIDSKGIKATFSDVVTMIGFLEFAQKNVDLAVIECQLGGRLDSTNVLEKPEVTAITSVAYDHMEILGSTLEAIAAEKAGIIKQGVPCFIGPTVTQDSVFRRAKEIGGSLIQIRKKNFLKANHEMVERMIESLGIRVGHQDLQETLNSIIPCRLERVPHQQVLGINHSHHNTPIVYLDVCSNPQAVEFVIKELSSRYPTQKIQVACGFQKQKDQTSILHYLATHKHVRSIYPITTDNTNLSSIQEIQDRIHLVEKLICSFEKHPSFMQPIQGGRIVPTLTHLLKHCGHEQDVLLVCGSHYLMRDVREFFNYEEERDEHIYPYNYKPIAV